MLVTVPVAVPAAVRQVGPLLHNLNARRVTLSLVAPSSPELDEVACAAGVEWQTIDAGARLSDIHLHEPPAQLAKTIRVASLQAVGDALQRPLSGPHRWTAQDMADGSQ